MKIVCLNTWHGGRLKSEITRFIESLAPSVDVFCFQEVDPPFDPIMATLRPYFNEVRNEKVVNSEVTLFQAILVRKDLPITASGSALQDVPATGLDLWVSIETQDGPLFICNYHGHPYPGEKLDNAERLFASRMLIEKAKNHAGPKIIMGDFNLLETTESIRMFEENEFQDLIKEYKIPTTRNHYVWDQHPTKQCHSDYAFVSKGVNVVNFEVPPNIVSDHQPLILEIE